MPNIFLPENYKIVSATAGCRTTNGGVTFDTIHLENALMVWIVAHFRQSGAHATTIQPVTGTGIASCATAITFSAHWWKNADVSSTDTLVAQTAGTSMACDAAATDHLLVIQINPADIVAQSATYTALGATIASSGQANNYVSAVYYIQERYPQATPATAIV
jgi:hypothetical protein